MPSTSPTSDNGSILNDQLNNQRPSDFENFESFLQTSYLNIKTLDEIKPFVINCYQTNCSEKIFFYCKCSDKFVLTCKTHISDHLSETPAMTHTPAILNLDFNDKNRSKLISYITNENLNLRKLKQKINMTFLNHVSKWQKEIDGINQNINKAIEKNNGKIMKCLSDLPTTYENIDKLTDFVESGFNSELTKSVKELPISNELMRIVESVVNDWNLAQTNYPSQESIRSPCFTNYLLSWTLRETNKICYYDFEKKIHIQMVIRGLINYKWARSISNDNYTIIQCGGEPNNAPVTNENLSHVTKIDIKKRTAQTLESMITGRSDFCVTLLNGFIYALGGVNYLNNITKKCEKYSLEYNRWYEIADLKNPRRAATCVSISRENTIYIIGGQRYLEELNELNGTIEKYDAALDSWSVIQTEKQILNSFLGSFLLPDSTTILIFGGKNSNDELHKECYFYNYETNRITDANPICGDFNSLLNIPILFNNKIYCYFWKSFTERELKIYDITSGVWSFE